MRIDFSGNYKSISSFSWSEIPSFVVLTGPNGAGKTQLLDLIYGAIAHRSDRNHNPAFNRCTIHGLDVEPGEVRLLRDRWELVEPGNTGTADIQGRHQNLHKQFRDYASAKRNQRPLRPRLQKAFDEVASKLGRPALDLSPQELARELPEDLVYDETQIFNEHVASVYYSYYLRSIELAQDGVAPPQIESKLGPKPWDVVDALLAESRLPFRLNKPSRGSLQAGFSLQINHKIHHTPVAFTELSSGEKILLSLVFFLFNSQHVGLFPKFLLLDEPDAHLHPAMTKQFLQVVHNVLVRRYGIRVFVTTHSPSTVALCPDGSLFEMLPGESRPQICRSKNRVIEGLTDGLVTVLPGARYVLVESGDDADCYRTMHDCLVNHGTLNPERPLVFISAADRKNAGGGKREVEKWASKLADSGLGRIFQGLRDSDGEDVHSDEIKRLPRHSLENYLLDPINVYGLLVDRDIAFPVTGVDRTYRRFQTLLCLAEEKLQILADSVHAKVEQGLDCLTEADRERRSITLLFSARPGEYNTVKLEYPGWLFERRGKTLLKSYQDVFGPKDLNHAGLVGMFKTLQIVPSDLRSVLETMQSGD